MPKQCTIDNCVKTVVGRGLCMGHYRRLLRKGTTEQVSRNKRTVETIPQKICMIEGCNEGHYGRGLCLKHLTALDRRGTLEPKLIRPKKSRTSHINKGSECSNKDCNRPAKVKGFCQTHYTRYMKYGNSNEAKGRGRPRKQNNA